MLTKMIYRLFFIGLLLTTTANGLVSGQEIKGLFLGDNGHHVPKTRFADIVAVMKERGISLEYSGDADSLNPENLAKYDCLLLYANIDRISDDQATALINYVEGGGGFVPLHCASYCFRNSKEVVALIGAQFQRHGTGVFRTTKAETGHEIMQGFEGFESWDETYVHTLHNEENRTVLEYRVDSEGKEPWTWTRTQGEGRVFYTAWGHDGRTWTNPGFQNLLERGIRWVVKNDPNKAGPYRDDSEFPIPEMTELAKDSKPFQYQDVGAKIPNYTPSERWGTQGKPKNMMQLPLDPQESMKHISVPKGFHLELYAADPNITGKPIFMKWDAKGRLWICETKDYPNNLQRRNPGSDQIKICEDTDGDGRADKFTVFADGLSIPTCLEFYNDGVIVQSGVETVFMRDTDGDDKVDETKVIFTGWSMGDTHGGVSNFRYGHDNWIWGMQGYNNSRPRAPGSDARGFRFRQGFFRFRPDGSDIEFIRSTNNNTWGLGFSEEGVIFGSTANGCPSVYMPIANRYYESVRGWAPRLTLSSMAASNDFKPITKNVRQVDFHGGYTAGAGHALYTARSYPKEYWNRVAFVNGPTGHLTGAFVISQKGTDYRSINSFNICAGDDEWFAPIMAEVGPDGHVWILDWYNYIVQHNPTPEGFKTGRGAAYETDLRDKTHGRIYRIVPDNKKQHSVVNLQDGTIEDLVGGLQHPSMNVRLHAQRLLVEKGDKSVQNKLIGLVKNQNVDEIGLNVGAIHALWTLQGLGLVTSDNSDVVAAVKAALKHPSAGVRRNAVKVLPKSDASALAVIEAGCHVDRDPDVKLAALLALGDLSKNQPKVASEIVSAVANTSNLADRWLPDALISSAAQHSRYFLTGLPKVTDIDREALDIIAIVAQHHARNPENKDTPKILASLGEANPRVIETVIKGFFDAGRTSPKPDVLDDQSLQKIVGIFTSVNQESQAQLFRLCGQWGIDNFEKYADEITGGFLKIVADTDASAEERTNAAKRLVEFLPNSDSIVEDLMAEIGPHNSPEVVSGMLNALAQSKVDFGDDLLEQFDTLSPQLKADAYRLLLMRAPLTKSLLTAAEEGDVSLDELALDLRDQLLTHPEKEIAERAKTLMSKGGSLPSVDRMKAIEAFASTAEHKGNFDNGKKVYVEHCSKCHIHQGEGHAIGPDLTGMAVHPKEHLLTEILDPSRNVEANFRTYKVVTLDGLVLSGMLMSESQTSIELVDMEGKRHQIVREDIDEMQMSKKSVMPEGFEKTLNEQAMTDLLEFLTKKGRFLPIGLDKYATVISTRSMFFGDPNAGDTIVFDDWKPKTAEGVPFQLVDPLGRQRKNVIILRGHRGSLSNQMPESVEIPVNSAAKKIHFLGGVGGWSYPYEREKTLAAIVRIKYADGETEDHELFNGVHFADYYTRGEVPKSKKVFSPRGKQVRMFALEPKRDAKIETIEIKDGGDITAPIFMAMTLELDEKE